MQPILAMTVPFIFQYQFAPSFIPSPFEVMGLWVVAIQSLLVGGCAKQDRPTAVVPSTPSLSSLSLGLTPDDSHQCNCFTWF